VSGGASAYTRATLDRLLIPRQIKGVVAMTDSMTNSPGDAATDDLGSFEPTEAEIDDWAARERKRREQWLSGPTAEERAQYAQRVRQRRVAEAFDEGEARISEGVRMGVRAGRETQLAAEGALNVLYRWSRRTFADLVRAGREWEEETSLPNRRRRVSLDDEDS
jgi:hypothetical protein